jgi:hypothetical protein
MKDAGGVGASKKLAKRKMDAYGCVQSHCFEVTDPKRLKSQENARVLAASIAEVNNTSKALQASKQSKEDDELVPLAQPAFVKLHKNSMNWAKLNRKEMRSLALKYFSLRIDKNLNKNGAVAKAQEAYNAAQTHARKRFDDDFNGLAGDPDPAQPEAIGAANDDEEMEDESDGDEDLVDLSSFKVGDKVRVYWSMAEPPEWFDGIVEKICAVTVKVKYPTSDSHYHHNPKTWDIIKV